MLPAPAYGYEAPVHPYFSPYSYNMNMAAYASPVSSYPFPVKSESSEDSSPTSASGRKFDTPEEAARYMEKRQRNNTAARKSRIVRKEREMEAVTKATAYENENKRLKDENRMLKQQNEQLKQQLQTSLCTRCQAFLSDPNPFSAATTTAQSLQLSFYESSLQANL